MTLVAGVDSSTQSTKVVVCDAATGDVIRSATAPHPDGTEVHPDRWWEALQIACGAGLLDDVAAISVAGQQHGMVLLDEQQEVVRPALLWNDTRSAASAAELVDELGAQEWSTAVGSVPLAAFTVTKLRWIAARESTTAERAATVVLPHDWLTSRLLTDDRLVTDRGDASGTGYWSPATGAYRTDLLERAFGRRIETPEVLAPHTAAGTTAKGIVVGPGTGDNMGAALGLGAGPGDVVVSLGTSGTAFAVHDEPISDPTGTVAGFCDATGLYLPLVCTLNAARVLVATAHLLDVELSVLDDLALAVSPGAEGLVLVPYLDGERTPNLPDATGTLRGLTRRSMTPANLARAAVEGLLCGLADAIDALRNQGVEPRRLLLIGGGSRSRAVKALAPSILGAPVVVPQPAEYVARGAALQAGWALTGTKPSWPLQAAQPLEPAFDAGPVREAYAAARDTSY